MVAQLATLLTLMLAPEPPVALILSTRGEILIRKPTESTPRKAAPRDFLWRGDRLTIPADGQAVLVFPEPGVREEVKGGAEITTDAKGVRPATAVVSRVSLPPSVVDGLRDLRPPPDGSRAGVVVFRSAGRARAAPAVAPIVGSLVASDRPEFAWTKADRVSSYWVRLSVDGSDRELWRVEATTNRLPFPKDQPALKRGRSYVWTVTDPDRRQIVAGRFNVADDDEVRLLDEAVALAKKSDDASNVLAAQLVLEALGAIDRAIPVGERLSRLAPKEPSHLDSLADLYTRAGRPEEAAAARSKAEQIRKPR
jgi:hypothetical protein